MGNNQSDQADWEGSMAAYRQQIESINQRLNLLPEPDDVELSEEISRAEGVFRFDNLTQLLDGLETPSSPTIAATVHLLTNMHAKALQMEKHYEGLELQLEKRTEITRRLCSKIIEWLRLMLKTVQTMNQKDAQHDTTTDLPMLKELLGRMTEELNAIEPPEMIPETTDLLSARLNDIWKSLEESTKECARLQKEAAVWKEKYDDLDSRTQKALKDQCSRALEAAETVAHLGLLEQNQVLFSGCIRLLSECAVKEEDATSMTEFTSLVLETMTSMMAYCNGLVDRSDRCEADKQKAETELGRVRANLDNKQQKNGELRNEIEEGKAQVQQAKETIQENKDLRRENKSLRNYKQETLTLRKKLRDSNVTALNARIQELEGQLTEARADLGKNDTIPELAQEDAGIGASDVREAVSKKVVELLNHQKGELLKLRKQVREMDVAPGGNAWSIVLRTSSVVDETVGSMIKNINNFLTSGSNKGTEFDRARLLEDEGFPVLAAPATGEMGPGKGGQQGAEKKGRNKV
ncbi:hypothetical protein PV05_10105 [Exophiala xenobiotica]|uniref:Uncharacterized protein n=1 Tax=Exophiala xenobiotica TaxID=348802 RepID=A0A0D2CNA6_9EURO|nr:uncharacterized protein PV05_10105 [Exophiala xenobiotica]KIW51377.1 hypothetical protein PV05_10105 [Exophiala xenobiotica]